MLVLQHVEALEDQRSLGSCGILGFAIPRPIAGAVGCDHAQGLLSPLPQAVLAAEWLNANSMLLPQSPQSQRELPILQRGGTPARCDSEGACLSCDSGYVLEVGCLELKV